MRGARRGLVICLVGALCAPTARAIAAPDPAPAKGSGDGGDIEMGDDAATPPAKPAATPAAAPPAPAGDAAPPDGDASTPPAAPVKDPALAKKLLAVAEQHAKKGDYLARSHKDGKPEWEQAVNAYQKAIEVGDDVNVYFALAQTHDKLGAVAEAVRSYRKVTTATTGVKPDIAKQATAKLDDDMTKVGLVTLTISPEGTSIAVAGAEVGKSPLTEPLVMMPGTYTFSLSADGYQPKDTELKVDPGSESERKIDLDPVPVIVKAVRPLDDTDKTPPPETHHATRWPMYAGAGGAVVLAGIASVTGVLAIHQHSTFVAPATSKGDRLDAQENGRDDAHLTDALFGGAVVVAAATAAYYWWVYRPAVAREHEAPAGRGDPTLTKRDLRPKLEVAPWVQVGTGGFAIGGQF